MTRVKPRPRRPLRNELLSLLPIVALPLTLGLLFPYNAIGFRNPHLVYATTPSCKVVELYEDVEARALDLVRSAFSVKPELFRTMREDLLLSPLPEEAARPILSAADRRPPAPSAAVAYEILPLPPTLAAPEPESLSADDAVAEPAPAFSREELLKIE